MIAAYTTWKRIQIKEIEHGNRMPMIPNIMVNSPGELKACLGEAPIVSFQWGEVIHYRTDTFDSTLIAEVLKEGAVALIVSHDGFIKACTRHEGRVVVYDSVSLPTT